MHELVLQRRSKLHESEGRVQFEVFEKLTSVCFFQIAQETIRNIYNMSGRVVSDIQTRAEGESLYI